ncbi:acyl-CoA N-acyltransferase [Dichotomopilus funicola]|uniref:Acyl-CoA N-acyltransferase n=1 Tax=Dichotomopilus funicola TaxID=1934379 RepID=A0AAN6V6D1_9PEZI|nr:acyl-CoA N-acyltransferase [Dichotomopilus funicola]
MGGGEFPPDRRLTLRKATLADLDDLTTVAQAGFPDDPEFDYRFPFRHEFPEDNRYWVHQEYREYLEQPDKYAVVVITAEDNDNRPVALSVWDLNVTIPHQGGDLGIPDDDSRVPRRHDANPSHFREFARRMTQGFQDFFGALGHDQIHLWLLCTSPAFRRRGAGTQLCRWGINLAAHQGVHTTVLASPMGKKLYEQLGFVLNGSFIIQVEGEEAKLEIWALKKEK